MEVKSISIRYKLAFLFLLSSFLALFSFMLLLFLFFLVFYNQYGVITAWMGQHMLQVAFASFIIILMLMNFYYLLMTTKGMKDLQRLKAYMNEISKGNLDRCAGIVRNDELGEVAEGLENLAKELKRARDEQKKLEIAKNELITNVSHDLRTPLTSILGYIQLAQGLELGRHEDLKQYMQIAYEKGNQLKELVENLFDYSKLTSFDFKLEKMRINLKSLLEQVLIGFLPQFDEAEMTYRLIQKSENVIVMADGRLLARLCENLISNSLKYGKNGRYIDVIISTTLTSAIVEVKNYGQAISEEDLPHIFERFYKGDKARSRQGGSTGLGLAIVKEIASVHGAVVDVQCDEKETVFRLSGLALQDN